MNKRIVSVGILILVLLSIVIAVQTNQSVKKFFFGDEELQREALAGGAGRTLIQPLQTLADLENQLKNPGETYGGKPFGAEIYEKNGQRYIIDRGSDKVYLLSPSGQLTVTNEEEGLFTNNEKIFSYDLQKRKWITKSEEDLDKEISEALNIRREETNEDEAPQKSFTEEQVLSDMPVPKNIKEIGNAQVLANPSTLHLVAAVTDKDDINHFYLIDPQTGNIIRELNVDGDEVNTVDKLIVTGLLDNKVGIILKGVYKAEGENEAFKDYPKILEMVKLLKALSTTEQEPIGLKEATELAKVEIALACREKLNKPECKNIESMTYGQAYDIIDNLAKKLEEEATKAAPVLEAEKGYDAAEARLFAAEPGSPEEEETIIALDEASEKLRSAQQETGISLDDAKTVNNLAKKFRQQAESYSAKSRWFEAIGSESYKVLVNGEWIGGDIAGILVGVAGRLGDYQAFSTLIFGQENAKNWLINADEAFRKVTQFENALPSLVCQEDEKKRAEEPGRSSSFVQTAGGTYQFVGAIQAERSPQKSPMLCIPNPDQEAEEEFICKGSLVCKEDGFCYKNEDAEEPENGYFYKIVWGVIAPTDEKFTPYVDENGKAIKFNLLLQGETNHWHFKRGAITREAVVELKNGERDGGTILRYSDKLYSKVCIKFHQQYRVKDYSGDDVPEICATIVPTTRGQVEYEQSDKSTPSVPSTAAEVSENTDW